jgi:hypothetical protein
LGEEGQRPAADEGGGDVVADHAALGGFGQPVESHRPRELGGSLQLAPPSGEEMKPTFSSQVAAVQVAFG